MVSCISYALMCGWHVATFFLRFFLFLWLFFYSCCLAWELQVHPFCTSKRGVFFYDIYDIALRNSSFLTYDSHQSSWTIYVNVLEPLFLLRLLKSSRNFLACVYHRSKRIFCYLLSDRPCFLEALLLLGSCSRGKCFAWCRGSSVLTYKYSRVSITSRSPFLS